MLQHLGCEVSFGVGSKMASAHPPIPRATPIATTPSQHLPQSFFCRPAEQVSPDLVGQHHDFGIEMVQALDAAHAQDIAREQHPTGRLSAVPAELSVPLGAGEMTDA